MGGIVTRDAGLACVGPSKNHVGGTVLRDHSP